MRLVIFILLYCLNSLADSLYAQSEIELSTGYATNKNLASGPTLNIAYEYKLYKKIKTKTQFGSKFLYHYNDFVGANIAVSSFELHQTISIAAINKPNFILKPNIGMNYRFTNWKGSMSPPLFSLPQRVYIIQFRNNKSFRLDNFDLINEKKYSTANLGYTFQLQSQFKIRNRIWLQITPFIEIDYDKSQSIGGGYIGIVLK